MKTLEKEGKKTHKGLKITLAIFACLFIAAAGVAAWQMDNIMAFVEGMTQSPEEIELKMVENEFAVKKEVVKYTTGQEIRDMTPEEKEQVRKKELTCDEVVEKILQEEAQKPAPSQTPRPTLGPEAKTGQTAEEITSFYVGKMYGLQGVYMGRLDGLLASAVSEYNALPKEQRTNEAKQNLMFKYMGMANSLEAACDGEVNGLLASMETELSAVGGVLSIISTMRSAYKREKSLKRAYYLGKLK